MSHPCQPALLQYGFLSQEALDQGHLTTHSHVFPCDLAIPMRVASFVKSYANVFTSFLPGKGLPCTPEDCQHSVMLTSFCLPLDAAGTRKKTSRAKLPQAAVPAVQLGSSLPQHTGPTPHSNRTFEQEDVWPKDTSNIALCLLMNAAVLAWEAPLLLQQILRQAADIMAAAGGCHAAAMFLQLSMATSVTMQQV